MAYEGLKRYVDFLSEEMEKAEKNGDQRAYFCYLRALGAFYERGKKDIPEVQEYCKQVMLRVNKDYATGFLLGDNEDTKTGS